MTTRIWIEPVKRPDGCNWYTDRNGLLLRDSHIAAARDRSGPAIGVTRQRPADPDHWVDLGNVLEASQVDQCPGEAWRTGR
jgi:hypothetical protein